jgi:hypothetical protein
MYLIIFSFNFGYGIQMFGTASEYGVKCTYIPNPAGDA